MASTASFSPMGGKEQGGDGWNAVIKVKYGDTLKRFIARVHQRAYAGQQQICMEYDMNQLLAKISGLFKFSHDSDLVLTYTDEDGDVVSLESDDDLRDAIISQELNPLRIDVQIKSYTTDCSGSKSVKNSDRRFDTGTPAHNGIHQLATELNSAVEKSLKSLPDPVRGVLSNLSHEIMHAASSTPAFNELFSLLSKAKLTNDPQSSHESVGKTMGMDLNTGDEPKVSTFTSPVPGNIQKLNSDGKSVKTSMEKKDNREVHRNGKSATEPPFTSFGTMGSNPIASAFNEQPSFFESPFEFPFTRVSQSDDVPWSSHGTPTLFPCSSMLHPYRRPYSCSNYIPRTFHRGVICDGCGMNPIIGPRYKSTIKENYDLCGTCFRDMGREAKYTRIDSTLRFPKSKKDHHKHNHKGHTFSTIVLDSWVRKLSSSFVADVTVWDGTVVRPSSRFTKIWKMRNTGTVAWPSVTQLVWVNGYNLGVHVTAELEIHEKGFPVDCELDIAVDCVAPAVPGKYISYWQMATPSGQKFGDEVWISIEVRDSQSSPSTSSPRAALNLNLPPESNQQGGPVIIDVESVPLDRNPFSGKLLEELLTPAAPDTPAGFVSVPQSSNAIPASSLLFTPGLQPSKSSPASSFPEIPASARPVLNASIDIPASTAVSYPLIDISASPNPPDINHTPSGDLTDESQVERTLLRELEEMGFVQTDLNKHVLRQNQYDLEQSVEELCEFLEWDPLLKELQEMGFNDIELNRKILMKNGGSIKRAVMELVTGKKGE